jgi:hypothetical protein
MIIAITKTAIGLHRKYRAKGDDVRADIYVQRMRARRWCLIRLHRYGCTYKVHIL